MRSLVVSRFSLALLLAFLFTLPLLFLGDSSGPLTAGQPVALAQSSINPLGGEQLCDTSVYDLGRMVPPPWSPASPRGPQPINFREGVNFDAVPIVARPNSTAQTVDVTVAPAGEFFFDPQTVTINAGDTVRWTWEGGGHNVTSGTPCTGNGTFCSPDNANCGVTSNSGFVYSRTFNQAGTFTYFCTVHCGFNMIGTITVNQVVIQPTENDFDGDGKADVAVYRPSAGAWYYLRSSDGAFVANGFGISTDRITPGDYDGDHKTDLSVYRPSDGAWYQILSQTGTFRGIGFGASADIPAANDFDGDGKTDIAVFRPSDGTWYLLQSSNGAFRAQPFGTNGDRPVAGDYDGDNKADFAVFRPSDGGWFILRSSNGSVFAQAFGTSGDKPVPGDYDGDNKNDLAVFRPADGAWYLLRSTAGFAASAFGISTDVPSPGDFDGDGKTDLTVYRDGAWYSLRSSNGAFTAVGFGIAGDRPIPAAYIQ